MRKISLSFNDIDVRQGKIVLSTKRSVKRAFLYVQISLLHRECGKIKNKVPITTFNIIRMTSVYCTVSPFITTLVPLYTTSSRAEKLPIDFFRKSARVYAHNQPSRCIFRKRCSENTQQIYRRKPMPKCDFNKIAFQL